MKKRKKISLLISLVCLLSFSVTSYAKEFIMPYWTNLVSMNCGFDIDYDGKAIIDVTIIADAGNTNQVKSTCKLQRLEGNTWKTIKTWNVSGNEGSNIVAYDETYYVLSNYSYRVELTAKAYYNGSLKETATEYFDYGWFS